MIVLHHSTQNDLTLQNTKASRVAALVRFKNGVTLNNAYVAHPDKGVLVAEVMHNIEFLEGGKMEQPDTGKIIDNEPNTGVIQNQTMCAFQRRTNSLVQHLD